MRRAIVFWLFSTGCASLHFVALPPEAQLSRVKTDDGWELQLVHYPAHGPSTGPPVLLCHGISANDRSLDLDEKVSLPRWLAAHGRDAWTMSLRGTGQSDRPDRAHGRPGPILFDSYWEHDLPAAIAGVKKATGAESIDFVGHSMGGMLLYAYLSQGGGGIRKAVTLGAPTRLDWGSFADLLVKWAGAGVLSGNGALPIEWGSRMSLPVQGLLVDDVFEQLLYDRNNTEAETWLRLIAYGTADIATGVLSQLYSLMVRGEFVSADHTLDFRKDMAKVKTPILVVASQRDRIALVPGVKDGYRALGGPKEWCELSKAGGCVADYGHMDYLIGRYASVELWPKVLAFLNRSP